MSGHAIIFHDLESLFEPQTNLPVLFHFVTLDSESLFQSLESVTRPMGVLDMALCESQWLNMGRRSTDAFIICEDKCGSEPDFGHFRALDESLHNVYFDDDTQSPQSPCSVSGKLHWLRKHS